MSLLFLFIKLYPFFGLSLGVLLVDLSRTLKRRGNKAWGGLFMFALLFFASTAVWLFFRGDKNADLWFSGLQDWFQGK